MPFSVAKQEYSAPSIDMSKTASNQVDYEKIRRDYLNNFEKFCNNMDDNMEDDQAMKTEVKDYLKFTKDYKKQLAESSDKSKTDSLTELLLMDDTERKGNRSSPSKKRTNSNRKNKNDFENNILDCQRRDVYEQHLKTIPLEKD